MKAVEVQKYQTKQTMDLSNRNKILPSSAPVLLPVVFYEWLLSKSHKAPSSKDIYLAKWNWDALQSDGYRLNLESFHSEETSFIVKCWLEIGKGGGYYLPKDAYGHHCGGNFILCDIQLQTWLRCGPVGYTSPTVDVFWAVSYVDKTEYGQHSSVPTSNHMTFLSSRSLRNYMEVLSMWQRELNGILYWVSTYQWKSI